MLRPHFALIKIFDLTIVYLQGFQRILVFNIVYLLFLRIIFLFSLTFNNENALT